MEEGRKEGRIGGYHQILTCTIHQGVSRPKAYENSVLIVPPPNTPVYFISLIVFSSSFNLSLFFFNSFFFFFSFFLFLFLNLFSNSMIKAFHLSGKDTSIDLGGDQCSQHLVLLLRVVIVHKLGHCLR